MLEDSAFRAGLTSPALAFQTYGPVARSWPASLSPKRPSLIPTPCVGASLWDEGLWGDKASLC